MALVSWKHNDRRQQWEATDDEGKVVVSITDEALAMMPPGALREFWASAIFMGKAVNETHSSGDSDSRDGCADGMLK